MRQLTIRQVRTILNTITDEYQLDSVFQVYEEQTNQLFTIDGVVDHDIIPILAIVPLE